MPVPPPTPGNLLLGPAALLPIPLASALTDRGQGQGPGFPQPHPSFVEPPIPPPRTVLNQAMIRGDRLLDPATNVFEEIPTPLDLVDNIQIRPPQRAVKKLPKISTAILDGPGPFNDIRTAIEDLLTRMPGPIGDIHNFRRAVRMQTNDAHELVSEELPSALASARDTTRKTREEFQDMNTWATGFAPEVLDAFKTLFSGAIGLVDDVVGQGVPFVPFI